jgi:hypothetical protein
MKGGHRFVHVTNLVLLIWSAFLWAAPCLAATRHYYIAAEDITWDYAPSGRDLIQGGIIPRPWTSQTRWPKTRYVEYSDVTFSMHKPQPDWLGILRPVIRAEVGDTIIVDFINRGQSPHGLRYDKDE